MAAGPIDGTRAFVTGRPSFGTLIALFHEGKPLLGLLDQPILEERWLGVNGRETVFTSSLGGVLARAMSALVRRNCPAPLPKCWKSLRMMVGKRSNPARGV